jgi:hypothetical protein
VREEKREKRGERRETREEGARKRHNRAGSSSIESAVFLKT